MQTDDEGTSALKTELALLLSAREDLTKKIDKFLGQLREKCPHSRIAEADYIPHKILASMPPMRMCLDCGVREEGWGSGYHVLTAEPSETYTAAERTKFYNAFPGPTEKYSWCYGDKNHHEHAVPKDQLTKGSGTRCSAYEGYFE